MLRPACPSPPAGKCSTTSARVPVSAELRNEKFEPVNDATVALTVTGDDGTTFQQHDGAVRPGRRALHRDRSRRPWRRALCVSMTARRPATKNVGSLETHFRRNDGVVEHFGTQQNRPLLQRIADSTGGRYWRLDQLGDLPEAMRYSKAGIVERQTLELWNLPALFLLLLLLKMGEWLLRLRWKTL